MSQFGPFFSKKYVKKSFDVAQVGSLTNFEKDIGKGRGRKDGKIKGKLCVLLTIERMIK